MEAKHLIYLSIAVLVTVFTVTAEELDNNVEEALQDDPTMASTEDLEDSLEPYYNDYGNGDLDKRGSMFRFGRGALFRFGKRGKGFRYGKRGGSIFRFGKRGGSLFRFGKRQDNSDMNTEEKRKSMFRYGRGDMIDGEKRKSMFRYGKRFTRDTTKRQKVHTPFRFGREEDEEV
ncbi:FMRFamide-like neuropeptides 7 isoform X2 [Lineus longissimus]|uniref:FMRFamide-like neuropeptides 7 isoform X2 n=1 Tax=Lineus longissimus TaxID=88925 RepID=UPI002B4F5F0E